MALRGVYDDDAWALSSFHMLRCVERCGGRVLIDGVERVIGERHLRIRVQHPDGGEPVDAVAFNQLPLQIARNAPVRLIYRLDVNTWRQTRTAQLVVEHIA